VYEVMESDLSVFDITEENLNITTEWTYWNWLPVSISEGWNGLFYQIWLQLN
jgi:hypothetical protein